MAKFLDSNGLSRLIAKVKAALNGKVSKVTSTDNAVVRFNGTTGDVQNSGVTINDNNQLIPETIGFKPKSRKFNGTGWFRIFSGTISPVHLMLTRNYYSPSPEGYDIDIETFDITVTDDLWGIATITQNAGYFGAGSTENQEIQKIRVYGYNGAPSTNPDNSDKKKLCIDVYITDRYPSGANTYYISGYSLGSANNFLNYAELTADNIEYVEFCQGKNSTRYYSEFTLVDGFKTNKKAVAQSFVKEGGTSSQFLLGDGSVTTLKTVNSTSLLGSGNVAVQPTLVSGTNIKTINNTSLLGSGNIALQTPLTFDDAPTANSNNPVKSSGIKAALDAKKGISDITTPATPDGTFVVSLDNGNDITVDFNHTHSQYQALLVSGTNIKTINNESLLGSGNISISGGGNVQPDWQQSDSTASDYIKNKPSIPTVPTNVSVFSNDAHYLKYQLVSTLPASPDSGTLYLIAESE